MQDPAAVPAPVNQFLVQQGPGVSGASEPDTFTLTFGHVTPPPVPVFNSAEEAEEFGRNVAAHVVPVSRLSFTPGRLRELHEVLGQVLAQNGLT